MPLCVVEALDAGEGQAPFGIMERIELLYQSSHQEGSTL